MPTARSRRRREPSRLGFSWRSPFRDFPVSSELLARGRGLGLQRECHDCRRAGEGGGAGRGTTYRAIPTRRWTILPSALAPIGSGLPPVGDVFLEHARVAIS